MFLHEIQVWAWNSEWVDRIPNGGEAQRDHRQNNLYSNHPIIDPGTWMPYTPTLEVAGVRFGTDKLAHMVSSGWTYYSEYHKGIKKGETPEDAERRAVDRGIAEENLHLGKLTSGVIAIPDLEASYGGMRFYLDLCDIEAVCSETDPSREGAPELADRIEIVSSRADDITAIEKVASEDEDRRRFALGLPGLHISYPLLASASLAVMLTSQPSTYDCTTPCDFRGPFLELEPGLAGGKLSIGWTRVTGKTNRSGSILKAPFIGAAYKVTVLRTWGDNGRVEAGRTYAGFEFGLPVVQISLGLGLLYRVDGGDDGPWMVVGGAGWGF